jgi:hypothetical protein
VSQIDHIVYSSFMFLSYKLGFTYIALCLYGVRTHPKVRSLSLRGKLVPETCKCPKRSKRPRGVAAERRN